MLSFKITCTYFRENLNPLYWQNCTCNNLRTAVCDCFPLERFISEMSLSFPLFDELNWNEKGKKDPLNVASSPVRIGHKNGSIEASGVQIYQKQFDQCLLSNDASSFPQLWVKINQIFDQKPIYWNELQLYFQAKNYLAWF